VGGAQEKREGGRSQNGFTLQSPGWRREKKTEERGNRKIGGNTLYANLNTRSEGEGDQLCKPGGGWVFDGRFGTLGAAERA